MLKYFCFCGVVEYFSFWCVVEIFYFWCVVDIFLLLMFYFWFWYVVDIILCCWHDFSKSSKNGTIMSLTCYSFMSNVELLMWNIDMFGTKIWWIHGNSLYVMSKNYIIVLIFDFVWVKNRYFGAKLIMILVCCCKNLIYDMFFFVKKHNKKCKQKMKL